MPTEVGIEIFANSLKINIYKPPACKDLLLEY